MDGRTGTVQLKSRPCVESCKVWQGEYLPNLVYRNAESEPLGGLCFYLKSRKKHQDAWHNVVENMCLRGLNN